MKLTKKMYSISIILFDFNFDITIQGKIIRNFTAIIKYIFRKVIYK